MHWRYFAKVSQLASVLTGCGRWCGLLPTYNQFNTAIYDLVPKTQSPPPYLNVVIEMTVQSKIGMIQPVMEVYQRSRLSLEVQKSRSRLRLLYRDHKT